MYAGNTAFNFDNYKERRRSPRRNAKHDVLIDLTDLGFLRGEIVDISYEGMFVNTHASILHPRASVELLFNVDGDVRRAQAYVVRRNAKGVGLWIDRHQKCNEWMNSNILPQH